MYLKQKNKKNNKVFQGTFNVDVVKFCLKQASNKKCKYVGGVLRKQMICTMYWKGLQKKQDFMLFV